MATAYKVNQFAITASNTSQEAFAASASNTVVSSVIMSDAAGADVTLSLKKSSTVMQVAQATITSGDSTQLLSAPLALEAGDKLMVTSTRSSGSQVVISYVEDTNSVAGQAIGVLSDVPDSLGTAGQVLAVNSDATGLVYVAQSGGGALGDLSDATTTSGSTGDVLVRNSSGVYTTSANLQELRTLLKTGTGTTTLTADGSGTSTDDGRLELTATDSKVKFATNSEMELTSTTARLKTGSTEVKMTETSPGEIDFIVAAGGSGSETAFTAVELNGQAVTDTALFDVKTGTRLRIESTTNDFAFVRNQAGADTIIDLPTTSGTLARTADVPANVTDLSDVTDAGSGAIITSTERTKLSGIATAATANDTDANLKNRANHTGTQTASTISDFDTEVSNNSTVAANAAKTSFPGFGTSAGTALEGDTALLQLGTTSTTALAGNTAVILTVNDITADQDGAVEIGLSEVTAGGTGVLGGNINVGGYKITSSSNGDIDLEPNGTGDVLLGNFKFDADQSVGASQDNHVLTYDNSTGKISLEAAPSGSSSGSGGGVCTIATITGVFRPGTSSDNGEDNIVAGGFRGANWYSWNNDVFTAANAVSSGLGTPGTSTFSSGTGYHIANGMFYVPQAGTAKFSVQMEFDSASEVAGETWRFFMWKIGSDEVSAIENGNYDSSWSGTLVASATLTIPSSFQSIAPGAVVSTNGSSVAEGDYCFITGVYDGTLSTTQDFPTNIGMYST